MKKIFIILTFCCCSLFSCTTLDTEPTDFTSAKFYFNTETDLNYALNSVYDILGKTIMYSGQDCIITYFDAADEFFINRTDRPPVYNYTSSDSWPNTLWQTLYQGIERANILLDNIDKPVIDETNRNIIKGQARFLRAYYYFVLVQQYGGVPLKLQPTSSAKDIYYPRASASEVYDFIIKEMEESENLVDPISKYNYAGRITKSAVQGILARVCLYKAGFPNNDVQKYADALTWAKKTIESGSHSLNPDYSQVFINMIQDKYDTKESIWEVEFYTTGVGDTYNELSYLGQNMGIQQNNVSLGYSGAQYKVHEALYKRYEATDIRRDWAIAPYYFQGNSTDIKVNWTASQIYDRFVGKFRREYELTVNKIKNGCSTNFPLLRYSDILLMAAEAENEVNGPTANAHQWLNLVRGRAHASLYTGTSIITDKNAFRKVIQDERSRELCFEGYRKLDLIRWGIFLPTMKALANNIALTAPAGYKYAANAGNNVSEKHYYLPIPINELSLDKLLTQNPGW